MSSQPVGRLDRVSGGENRDVLLLSRVIYIQEYSPYRRHHRRLGTKKKRTNKQTNETGACTGESEVQGALETNNPELDRLDRPVDRFESDGHRVAETQRLGPFFEYDNLYNYKIKIITYEKDRRRDGFSFRLWLAFETACENENGGWRVCPLRRSPQP